MIAITGRRRVGPHRSGGGGGGGSGTIWDDEFSTGSAIDTTGARFASAIPWTQFGTGVNYLSANVSGGQLSLAMSSNGLQVPRGAYMPVPVGNFAFETTCSLVSTSFYPAVGIILAETATGKYLIANFCNVFGYLAAFGDQSGLGTYGTAAVAGMSGKIELSRSGTTLTMRHDVGAGWVTTGTAAQGTAFTTAPDYVGLFVQNENTANPNTGVFDYWRKTA